MSRSIELVCALLPEFIHSDTDAEAVLVSARLLGVDPLDYCIHRFGLGADEVMARAAGWAGLAFSPVVPSTVDSSIQLDRIDHLAVARSIRESIYGREVLFIAPRFDGFVNLRSYQAAHPEFRRSTCIAPPAAIRSALARFSAAQLLDEARQRLFRHWPDASAHLDLSRSARLSLVGVTLLLVALSALAPHLLEAAWVVLLGVLLVLPAVFRVLALLPQKNETPLTQAPALADADLPVYSVLIPLRDEAHMVPLLRRAMSALSYPPEKLDIKFVVEAGSEATVAAVRELLADPRFELLVVPPAPPYTKPKALNYALPFVRGAHVVVFDAEDIPNPDQLRLAAAAFAADPGVDCLQAELLVDNARENLLTGLFAGEYAGQFGLMMPALVRWSLPVPLGGTSNHFRTASLLELGGWDAFNVTEDADLGVRLARLRYRTGMLTSQTYEEAPISLGVWMHQRTRWMKGWMQTYIVHNHHPLRLARDMGWKSFLAFEIHVGSLIVSPLLHTAFLFGLLMHPLFGAGPLLALDDPRSIVAMLTLLFGYGSALALVGAGLLRLGQRRLLPIQLLLPLYWTLHAIATIRAGYQLLTRPHFWAKTTHGLTRLERSFAAGIAPREEVPAEARAGAIVEATGSPR